MIFGLRDVMAVIPEAIVAGAACLLLLVDFLIAKKRKIIVAALSIAAVAAAAFFSLYLVGTDVMWKKVFAGMFVVDGFSTFFKFVLYLATVLSMMLSFHYVKEEDINTGEYYTLMLFSLSGMMIAASASDLLSIYVAVELMSIPVYVLVGFLQKDARSNEAAMKYVILGAFSSGVLLYGISFIYGITGTTELSAVAGALADPSMHTPALSIAIIMLVAGFGFKIAGVPFHMWAPDAYEGAPTPITGFMSAGPKAAACAAVLRVFTEGLQPAYSRWVVIVAIVAVLSLVYGNIVAIAQKNIKRMLAYSSIGHVGYALLGLVAGGTEGASSVMYYMAVYAFMNLGAFSIIIMMRKGEQKGEMIEDYTGLAKTRGGMALLMLIFMFSLAGLPPTAGFIGKFYIFMALIHKGMVGLAVIAVLMSAVGAYFYIRIVMLMYMKDPVNPVETASSRGLYYALAIAAAGTILLGVYPGYFIKLAQMAGGSL
ncbi:MAG: NADH-quinone oxidoreductase subunit N [Deltaproteobacteria bacterium]|nr:NADH-quinone oxidoreductase subunit N [Deltaproteobacteria bacterium]